MHNNGSVWRKTDSEASHALRQTCYLIPPALLLCIQTTSPTQLNEAARIQLPGTGQSSASQFRGHFAPQSRKAFVINPLRPKHERPRESQHGENSHDGQQSLDITPIQTGIASFGACNAPGTWKYAGNPPPQSSGFFRNWFERIRRRGRKLLRPRYLGETPPPRWLTIQLYAASLRFAPPRPG
jgi:hypothetical protein